VAVEGHGDGGRGEEGGDSKELHFDCRRRRRRRRREGCLERGLSRVGALAGETLAVGET
jgi:hypothetical protein